MNKIKKTSSIVLACTAGCFLPSTNADILFFLLDEGEQGTWEAALQGHRFEIYESFNVTAEFGDPGIVAFDGPIFIGNIGFDSNEDPYGSEGRNGCGAGCNGLRLIGPSAGFGNEDTALLAGQSPRSEDIFPLEEYFTAVELNPATFINETTTVAITVYDPDENSIAQILHVDAEPHTNNRIGILATDGDRIGRINIYNGEGVEGFMGFFVAYVEGPAVAAELTDFEIKTGVLLQGDINDLNESDDVNVRTRSGFGQRFSETHLMEIVISARTDESVRRGLNLAIESRISDTGGTAKVRLRNWRTGEFEPIGQYSIGLTEEVITFEDIDATDYVRTSGAMELSIKHVVFVPFLAFRFDSFIDFVEITVE